MGERVRLTAWIGLIVLLWLGAVVGSQWVPQWRFFPVLTAYLLVGAALAGFCAIVFGIAYMIAGEILGGRDKGDDR